MKVNNGDVICKINWENWTTHEGNYQNEVKVEDNYEGAESTTAAVQHRHDHLDAQIICTKMSDIDDRVSRVVINESASNGQCMSSVQT